MVGVPYRELVGCLYYVANGTRPDIANAVREVSRYVHRPGWQHWIACKRILRYLRGTAGLALTYHAGTSVGQLCAFADSDWSNDVDTSRSVGATVFMLGGAAVTWSSRRQRSVALSSGEAEYYACAEAGKQSVFLRMLLQDLGFPADGPTVIFEDSSTCVSMVNGTAPHGRSRHVRRQYHFIRDLARDGLVELKRIPSSEQVADALTKALSGPLLRRHRDSLMGVRA